jgi:hypothetical protein
MILIAFTISANTSGLLRNNWNDFGQRTEEVYALVVQTLTLVSLPELISFSEDPSIGQRKHSLLRQFRNQGDVPRRIITTEYNGQIDIRCAGSSGIDQVIAERLSDIFRKYSMSKIRKAETSVCVFPLHSMRLHMTPVLQENLGMRHFMQKCNKKAVRIKGMIHRDYRRTGWTSAPEVAQFAPPGPCNTQYNMVLVEPRNYRF